VVKQKISVILFFFADVHRFIICPCPMCMSSVISSRYFVQCFFSLVVDGSIMMELN